VLDRYTGKPSLPWHWGATVSWDEVSEFLLKHQVHPKFFLDGKVRYRAIREQYFDINGKLVCSWNFWYSKAGIILLLRNKFDIAVVDRSESSSQSQRSFQPY